MSGNISSDKHNDISIINGSKEGSKLLSATLITFDVIWTISLICINEKMVVYNTKHNVK